ncbi:DUF3052 domain-containing protein [Nocardioides sp.]|uniref:DUF3052 domain-containing protein n=1 Tax=Nocardioides sp. TaxID=35761 RepID=UPI003D12D95D
MAGYSGTPLPQKIGVKDGLVVFLDNAPESLELTATHARLPRQFDVALTFHTSRATLTRRLPLLIDRMSTTGMIWVCWPKKASKVPTDLSDDFVRVHGLSLGVVDVKVAAIDEVWSGLKFVRRLKDR